LINYSKHTRQLTFRSQQPGSAGATVERLTAPNLRAVHGTTLAGQSFARRSATGRLAGSKRIDTISADDGVYSIRLRAASAALITLRK
jgi:hypothetical protein